MVAVMHEVLPDHPPAERPADQHWLAQPLHLNPRRDVVGPALAVLIVDGIARLPGVAMAAQVEGDEAEVAREIAAGLAIEGEMTLRLAVNQQDFRSAGVAPFVDREGHAVGGRQPIHRRRGMRRHSRLPPISWEGNRQRLTVKIDNYASS